MPAISPLAPQSFPLLPTLDGVRLGATEAHIRYGGRDDLMLAELGPGSAIAGVFTRSLTPGSPVLWCRERLKGGRVRAIVVNSGNANVFTGRAGREAVAATAQKTAQILGCSESEVFVASTGVIGEVLPVERVLSGLEKAARQLSAEGWERAARAILTTDTFPKGASAATEIAGAPVRVSGFAKGSGMIAPDMATMLAFLFTDARLPHAVLQSLLAASTERSFNAITVDGDTSTSDTVLLSATGRADNPPIASPADPSLRHFRKTLESVMIDLAQQVVRDGEGAQKFVTIEVSGAQSARAARRVGLAIANSPLVKTALSAADPNWGRIVMAVGKAGEKADRDRLKIAIGGIPIAAEGGPVPGYDERPVAEHMKGRNIAIAVDLGVGRGKAVVWTCDLTHGYIDINASYRS